jgi:AmiR/NasT family two-component response regulator
MGNYEQFFSLKKEKAVQFSVYYHTLETSEYLCQVVMTAARLCQVKHLEEGLAWGDVSGADVVLVECQDNNPPLDAWLAQTTKTPGSPEIFLFVEEVSPGIIWKALKLGARELFSDAIPAADFQEAIKRVELRRAKLWQAYAEAWSGLAGWSRG